MEKYKTHKHNNVTFKIENDENIKIKGQNRYFRVFYNKLDEPLMVSIQNAHTDITLKTDELYVNEGLSFTTMDTVATTEFPITFTIKHDSEETLVLIEKIKHDIDWWDEK